MPAMIDGILETALYVTDIERSAAFYERVLGFKRLLADDRLIGMAVADSRQILLLFKIGASTQPSPMHGGLIPAHDGQGSLHAAFAISESNLPNWRIQLSENDVPIESELVTDRGGTSLYFRDPDNHLIELATPGIWPTY
ncbi:MAG: VOC family protein [Cytophagales bacterium]|nr:VOC family protein [Armatimonadota bacterium]